MKTDPYFARFVTVTTSLSWLFTAVPTNAQFDDTVQRAINSFEHIGEKWDAGETNLPLLSIQWFPHRSLVRYTRVETDGRLRNGSFSSMGAKGWGPCGFTTNDLDGLRSLISAIPAAPTNTIPAARKILVHGLRSNSWFAATFDRADIPVEVEKLCERVCERPEWIVPVIKTNHTNVYVPGGWNWEHQITTAARAPVLLTSTDIDSTTDGIQVWNLEDWRGMATNNQVGRLDLIALSPDGKVAVLAQRGSVFAVRIPEMTNVWVRRGGDWCRSVAAIDDGRSLAVAFPEKLERWSIQSGEFEGLLATNGIVALRSSRDGTTLVAEASGNRILVWKSEWNRPPKEIKASGLMDVSPDGRRAAFKGALWSGRRLTICDLNDVTCTEMPVRAMYYHEIQYATWSPDGKYLAVGADGSWPCVYDTSTWKPVLSWAVPGEAQAWGGGGLHVFIAFAADGTLVARANDRVLRALKFPVPMNVLKSALPEDW